MRFTLGFLAYVFVLGLRKVAVLKTFFFLSANFPPFNTALEAVVALATAADFLGAILMVVLVRNVAE